MTDWTKDPLTVNDMWSLANSKENTNCGIVGYESPKIYFDHKKSIQDKEYAAMHNEVWVKKGHYPKIKLPVDKEGKEIIPTKKIFIEEHIKNANSNFSKEKFDAYVEMLKGKGKTLEEVEGIKPAKKESETAKEKKRTYTDRITIIDEIINDEKKKLKYPPHVEELVNKVKEKHAKYSSSKDKSPRVAGTSKDDRVSFLCDAQYLAEKTPFYSKRIENAESPNKKEKEFFPEKLNVLPKSPQWKYPMPMEVKKEPFMRRDEIYNEKINELKKSWDSRKVKFIDDVALSYFKIKGGSKGAFKYSKASKLSEQYNTAKTLNPLKYPSPQEYFKTPIINPHNSPKKKKEDTETSPKINYVNRERADKISTRPMKSYVF